MAPAPKEEFDVQNFMVIAATLLLVCAVPAGVHFWAARKQTAAAAAAAATEAARKSLPGRDADVAKLADEYGGGAEVVQWIKADNRRGVAGFLWTRDRTEKIVDDWYRHGAKTVLAFGKFWTTMLAVELPDDADQRKYFFDNVRFWRREGMDSVHRKPQVDVHQKYLVIDFMPGSNEGGPKDYGLDQDP